MKFIPLRKKLGTVPTWVQVQSPGLCRKCCLAGAAFIALTMVETRHVAAQQSTTGTSALEILQQAPKVRFDEPDPTPLPREPIPYVPPTGPAPVIKPAYPAITPYAGNTIGGRPAPAPAPTRDPYYQAPAPGMAPSAPVNTPPRYLAPGPTPRPVLGPEDVEPKEKKRGFVRGLINAIPFVGDDDDEQERPAETPERDQTEPGDEQPIYRGYDAAPPASGPDGSILMPPGGAPVRDTMEPGPEPSSPPIMTPEPRGGIPPRAIDASPGDTLPDEFTAPGAAEPTSSRPILTVKRESDTTGTQAETAPTPNPTPAEVGSKTFDDIKEPAGPDINVPTPRPLEKATTSVIIQNSRGPVDEAIGPQPDPSATTLEPFDPTKPKPVSEAGDIATSLTIEQADLGMPNPTYEQNAVILGEFQDAVRKARASDYEAAATMFREYGQNHPSSGLAPRAYYLSIIFEKNRPQARKNLEAIRRLFPESRYVRDIDSRRPDLATTAAPDAVAVVAPGVVPDENPRQKVARLEGELTAAVGDMTREPELRKQLGVAYLDLEEYDRAYEVLRPAVEMSSGKPLEAEVLMAMARVLAARRETVQAISLYESVEEKNPALIYQNAPSAWSVGLAYEGAGRYTKARTIYNNIRQKWPQTPEAGWATTRLNELAALAR